MARRESQLKDWIESRYAIGPVARCDWHPVGFINHTYKVETTGGQYALTEFLHKSSSEVMMRADVVLRLKDLPVARPIASVEGKHVEEFKGHPIWLCPWLEGASPKDREDGSGNMSDMQRSEAVHFFKDLHRQLRTITNRDEDLGIGSFANPNLPETEGKTTRAVQRLIDECRECYQGIGMLSTAERELVHKDFERHNLLFGETERLIGILDFDSLRAGDMLYEWAHIMFNHVCDDALPSPEALHYYMENSPFNQMADARTKLFALMARFCADDIRGFAWIAQRRRVALSAIADRYRRALAFAKKELQTV